MQVWSYPRTIAMQAAHVLCACRMWFCRQLRFVEVAQLTDSVQQAEIKNIQTHCISVPCKLYQPLALPFSLSTWPSFSEVGFLGGFFGNNFTWLYQYRISPWMMRVHYFLDLFFSGYLQKQMYDHPKFGQMWRLTVASHTKRNEKVWITQLRSLRGAGQATQEGLK